MRLYRLTAILLLLWPTIAAQAADDSTSQPQQEASSKPASPNPRFDGYSYLDVEGKQLPIQSNAEIEAFLAEAEIIEDSPLGTGITLPRKVVLQGDGFRAHAIFKHVNVERHKVTKTINGRNRFSLNWRDWHGYDAAAYVLDRLLGMDRVPPTVPRKIGRDSGTMRIWLEETVNEFERSRELLIPPPNPRRWNQQRSMMLLFDNLVANRDSNLGNLLIDANWRLWFIDCTRCFGTDKTLYFPLDNISHCERGFWQGLKDLNASMATEHLSPYLNKMEIKALLARRDLLVRHFQKLIDELGEEAVLFGVLPPDDRAPWGDDERSHRQQASMMTSQTEIF